LNRPADVVNASCPGYSSFQGLRRLDDVWAWRPDLLVVFFGWNDHWKSLNGCTDRELADRQKLGAAQEWLGYSRIYWTAYSALARPRRRDDRGAPVRVPLDDYQNNLTEILRQARRRQCQVLMITAPTALVEGQLPAWVYPFFGRWYNMSLEEILAIPKTHAQYNEVVRRVAAEHRDAALLDLAASWPQVDTSARFRNDSIHLTEAGHEAVAAAMFELWSQSHIP
jgi:lysophospholipase L1-like esterase